MAVPGDRTSVWRWFARAVTTVVVLLGLLLTPALPIVPAEAANGDGKALLGNNTASTSTAAPGTTIQYSIGYQCSNSTSNTPLDGCNGATFALPLPQFTNIYGSTSPVTYVSATAPTAVWASGFTLDSSDSANPVVRGTATTWAASVTGTIVVTVRVPYGIAADGTQALSSTATVTDPAAGPDSSTTATTSLTATTGTWALSVSGPTGATPAAVDQLWTISVCAAPGAALRPFYTITDTLPPGAQFVSATNGGTYTDDNISPVVANSISDGGGVVTWQFSSSNAPPIESSGSGCFRTTVTARFPLGYVDPNPVVAANDNNLSGAVKMSTFAGVSRMTVAGATTDLGTATSTLTLSGFGIATLSTNSTATTTASPGTSISYAISYSCSNSQGGASPDGCNGATFAFPLPTFSDAYGGTSPVTYVGFTAPVAVWAGGLTLDSSNPSAPVLRGTASSWAAGTSGTIQVNVSVPRGTVASGTQVLSATATVTDPESGADPSTTATTSLTATTGTWTLTASGPGDSVQAGVNQTWTLNVCATATAALRPFDNLTATLPAGLQFASAGGGGTYSDDNVAPVAADTVSDGGGVVTWSFNASNIPSVSASGCFSTTVTGRFNLSYVDPNPTNPANDNNVGGAVKVTSFSGTSQLTAGGATTNLGTPTTSLTLPAVVVSSATSVTDNAGGGDYYVAAGNGNRFVMSGSLTGFGAVDSFTITDGSWSFVGGSSASGTGMPESFVPTQVIPGTWTGPLTATIEGSDDNFASVTQIATGVASGAATITLSTPFRSIRFRWGNGTDSVPSGFAPTGIRIVGVVAGAGAPSTAEGRYTNQVTVTATRGASSWPSSATANYMLETPQPDPGVNKSISSSTRQPGQSTTYTLSVSNSGDATGSLTNPYVEECVGAYQTVQSSTLGAGWASATPAHSCAAGLTPLRWNYTGTLTPGQTSPNVSYTVLVNSYSAGPIAPPGNYISTTTVRPAGGGSFGHCSVAGCARSATLTVSPVIDLSSRLCVRGDLDNGILRPSPGCQTDPGGTVDAARTRPGGEVEWQLNLVNAGNTDSTNISFITMLPRVGDTAVITTTASVLNPRFSEFENLLVSQVNAPPGWTVSFSTATNPCRSEVGGVSSAGVNCTTPNWVTNPSTIDLPTYRSMRLSFSGVVPMGSTATFQWSTRTPVYDATYDQNGVSTSDRYEFLDTCSPTASRTDPTHCPRAVNSFAYGADATNLPPTVASPGRLTAEPPQAEVRITQRPTPVAIGDRVWFDRNLDGAQSIDTSATGEPGIAGVLVELRRCSDAPCSSTDATGQTYTDANGNYLFGADENVLLNEKYVVRFYRTSTYIVTLADQSGAGDAADSDIPRVATGSDAVGTYHDSPVVTVTSQDTSVDAGYWTPAPAATVSMVTKDTAWADATAGDAVTVMRNRPLTFLYTVTNSGNTRLENVTLTDDRGPNADVSITNCTLVSAGTNSEGLTSTATAPYALNRGAVLQCTGTATAGTTGHTNTATVTGAPRMDDGTAIGFASPPATVNGTDTSSHVVGKYDLALATTVGTPDLAAGTAPFTVTVLNEGTVASGAYEVTGVLPTGLSVVGTPSPAPSSTSGATRVWTMPSLAAGASTTITFTVRIDDYLVRPYRWYAEISSDSAAAVQTGGVSTPVVDADSTPDALISNDNTGNGVATGNGYGTVGSPASTVDNVTITEAGSRLQPETGDDAADGEDDADIADLVPNVSYDLALVMVASPTVVGLAASSTFTITVANQGNVPSQAYTVSVVVPTGMTFVSSPTGTYVAGSPDRVTFTGTNLAPGTSATFSWVGTAADAAQRPFRAFAEVSSDSAAIVYATTDKDSVPDTDTTNDGTYGARGSSSLIDNLAIADAGVVGGDPADDADIADVDVNDVSYDLALAVVADAATVEPSATVTYTVTVANQGNVSSRQVDVTAWIPTGMAVVDAGGAVAGAGTLVFTIADIAPGITTTRTFTTRVTDVNQRPFRVIAEITADGADGWDVPAGVVADVEDFDSVPDSVTTNDGAYGAVTAAGAIDNLGANAIASAGVGSDPSDDADIADVAVNVRYDLAVAHTASAAAIGPSGTVTFTVTVTNAGNVPSGAFTVFDPVPTGLGFASSPSGVYTAGSPNRVVFTGSTLLPGASATFTWVASVTDYTKSPFSLVAALSANSAANYGVSDNTAGNDSAAATVEVRGYDVAIAIAADAAVVQPSATIGYTITVSNIGNVASKQVVATVAVPAGLTVASLGGATDNGNGTISWTITDIATGASTIRTFTATVDDVNKRPFLTTATITANGADDYDMVGPPPLDIEDINPTNDTASRSVTVTVTYDLALVSTADRSIIGPADTVTYTITVVNQGNVPSQGYTVVATVPNGLAFAASPAGVHTPGSPATVSFNGTSLAPGASATFTWSATVASITPVDYRSVAEVATDSAAFYSVSDIDSTPDSITTNDGTYGPLGIASAIDSLVAADAGVRGGDPSDDADIADVRVIAYDLGVAVTASAASIQPSGTAVVTATVTNLGNVAAHTTVLRAAVPTGMTVVGLGGAVDNGDGTISWTIADIAVGAAVSRSVTLGVTNPKVRPFRVTAQIAGNGADDYDLVGPPPLDVEDSTAANDSAFVDVGVDVVYDLSVTVAPDETVVTPGDPITYTITVVNQGNVPSDAFTVADVVADGLAFVSSPDGVYTPGTPNRVVFTGTSLAPGASATFTWVAAISDSSKRPFIDGAQITSTSAAGYGVTEADLADNADSSSVDVRDIIYDLSLAAESNTALVAVAGQVTYTVTVRNRGNLASRQVVVRAWVPNGMTVTDLGGAVDQGNGTIDWTIADIAPDTVVTRTFIAQVSDARKRPFRMIAEITSDSADYYDGTSATVPDVEDIDSVPDSDTTNDGGYGTILASGPIDNIGPDAILHAGVGADPSDDADIVDVDIDVAYELAVAAAASPATVAPDGTITYTITVTNNGNVASGSYQLSDPVPLGLTFVSSSTGSLQAGSPPTVVFAGTDLAPASTATFTWVAKVVDPGKRPFATSPSITANAAASYTATDIDAGNDVGATTVDMTGLVYDIALTMSAPAATMAPDAIATYVVTVTNQGNLTSHPAVATAWVPSGMAVVDAGGASGGPANTLSWNIPDIAPGASATRSFTARSVDMTRRPFRAIAEITADGADYFDIPAGLMTNIEDADSTPNNDGAKRAGVATMAAAGTTMQTSGGAPEDDVGEAAVDVSILYDLALTASVDKPVVAYDGTVTFSIVVTNQGNVASGSFAVADTISAGMTVISVSDGGTAIVDPGGATQVSWSLSGLAPAQTRTLLVVARPTDLTKRPYRSTARIVSNGASALSSPTATVSDADGGVDDVAVSDVDVDVRYDLALFKRTAPGQTVQVGAVIVYEIAVRNEGNVPSGAYSVADILPSGMSFESASDNAVPAGRTVVWSNLPSIPPGGEAQLYIRLRIVDATLGTYRNVAEITSDGSSAYATVGDAARDVDSTPNPSVVGATAEQAVVLASGMEEDDRGVAEIAGGTVTTGAGNTLPATGSSLDWLVDLAGVLVALGLGFAIIRRLPRRRAPLP